MITRTDVIAHLEYGMKSGFLKGQKAYTKLRAPFVREAPSSGAYEIYGDMGAVPWPRQNGGQPGSAAADATHGGASVGGLTEGGPITVLGGNERAVTVWNNDWQIPIGIYHNAIEDNRVGGLEEWARSAGQRFDQHMDYLCFNALNAGATTTYGNSYDGVTFFNASHADHNAEYTTAQSNVNTSALSLDNFETVYIAASKYLDDRGQPTGLIPDLLIVPTDLKRTGVQITGNSEAYDTGNREINPYAGGIKLLVAPGGWLDSTAWFVGVSGMVEKPITLQIRQQPQLAFWDDHTQGNGIRYYKWVSRYAVSYGDWRLMTQGQT